MARIAHTVWKESKYGPQKTPYLHTFHVVQSKRKCLIFIEVPHNKKQKQNKNKMAKSRINSLD